MKRILGAVLSLPLLAVPATGAVHAISAHPSTRTTPLVSTRAAASDVLDQDTLVRRCLPQLKDTGETEGTTWSLKPLSTSTVVPAKPLVNHRAGDVVAFLGQIDGSSEPGVQWARMLSLCKVPASDPSGAPGSAPLPASETQPSKAQRARDLQLCTEAPDITGFFSTAPYDENQVVVPDVRSWRFAGEAWGSTHVGIQLLTDRNEGFGAICSYGFYGSNGVLPAQPSTRVRQFDYANGGKGEPDRYYAAGFIPSDVNNAHPLGTTITVTPPGRKTQRFAVRTTGMAGNGGIGSYAFTMTFPPVTSQLGTQHTVVKLLAKNGKVVWSGTWDVGYPGR